MLSLPKWFIAAVGVVSAGIVLCFFIFPSVLSFAACVLLLATIVVITVAYRRAMRAFENFQLETRARENVPLRQMQSCFWLFSRLQLRRPLPPMGGWAIGPDFAAELVSIVLAAKPRVIVEASSGVSTLLIAYCLEQLGSGECYITRPRATIRRPDQTGTLQPWFQRRPYKRCSRTAEDVHNQRPHLEMV